MLLQQQQQQQQHQQQTQQLHAQQPAYTATPSVALEPVAATMSAKSNGASEEFVIFGSYVAEVMRNMDKQKARMLQMKVMQLIAEYDGGGTSN